MNWKGKSNSEELPIRQWIPTITLLHTFYCRVTQTPELYLKQDSPDKTHSLWPKVLGGMRCCRMGLYHRAAVSSAGSRKGWPFPSTHCFPLTWVATKGKDSTSKQESRGRGSSESRYQGNRGRCDTEPEVLHHSREDAVTLELDVLQATQTWKLQSIWHKVGNDAIPYQEVNATMYFATVKINSRK